MQNVNLVPSINRLDEKTTKNIHIITSITWCSVDRALDVNSLMIAPPHDALLWQQWKKKNHAAENFFPPSGKRKQLSEIWSFGSHVCTKPHDWFCFYTFFFLFFFFFPHCNFWALCEPSLCNLRRKTAAIRWQLWTFHLSAISRRSESSVCLSKLFSVFNLNCFSVFFSLWHTLLLPFPLAQVRFQKMWEILMRGVSAVTWLLLLASEHFQVFKRMYRGCIEMKASDKLSTSWYAHFLHARVQKGYWDSEKET